MIILTVKFDRTLNDISIFFKNQGYFYTDEQIYNLYTSLKTKPFVILSGISGSGKSKIIDLFAEYMGKSYGNEDNYELVAVKPNWTDSRGIFGYHNLLNDTYQITPALKLFLRALADPGKPYFLVLDEMNLAKVEYYFSDFLSLIESRRPHNAPHNYDDIESILGARPTLSEVIILSAIQKSTDEFKKVVEYRETPIARWWFDKYSSSQNPTEQFRSELNQGRSGNPAPATGNLKGDGIRLAGKAFWAKIQGNSYKLKKDSELDDATLNIVNKLRTAFRITSPGIKQEKILLHNFPEPLKTFENQNDYTNYLFSNDEYYVPSKIEIPLNLFVVGTVNVDETTYMFSPKVLDRSNVIEFNEIDIFNAYGYGSANSNNSQIPTEKVNEPFDMYITLANMNSTKYFQANFLDEFKIVIEIFECLKSANRQFGYRVFNEISSYIINYCGFQATSDEIIEAIDLQLLQKIMPKINGTDDEILGLITSLISLADEHDLIRSKKKLERMANNLNMTGYTTFIE